MFKKIKQFFYWVFIAKPSGLDETPFDGRDFNTGIFKWFGYTPKHKKHIIETLSTKNQGGFNTCQWNATAVQKEIDEKTMLSVRLMVSKAKTLGYVSGNGFSNLRSGQKVMQEWGMVEFGTIDENITNWNEYVKPNPGLYNERAAKHKIGSYWSANSRNDALKLLDDGRTLTTGIKWYTSFNQGGGFKSPWIIDYSLRQKGYYVGGHAFLIIGYDLDYHGKEVYVCKNSYGEGWGDKGKFYVEMSYLDANNYGYFTNLDEINPGVAKTIIDYDGKNIKGDKRPGIYHIQAGKKKPYTSWLAYLAWNGLERGYTEISQDIVDEIADGDIMDIKKTNYWNFLKQVKKDQQMDKLLELLNKEN